MGMIRTLVLPRYIPRFRPPNALSFRGRSNEETGLGCYGEKFLFKEKIYICFLVLQSGRHSTVAC